jgi:microsomal dipeptidase-like Zn-dependent dipeptidase
MRSSMRLSPLLAVALIALSAPSGGSARSDGSQSNLQLANGCVVLASALNGGYVAAAGQGYGADQPTRASATAFYMKPTGLGTYLLYDEDGGLLGVDVGTGGIVRAQTPGKRSEWALVRVSPRRFRLESTLISQQLAVAPAGGRLILTSGGKGRSRLFDFAPARHCRRFPEANLDASGRPFAGTNPDGTVFGFVDAHLHITADMRAGGGVISGRSFSRFGITRALGGDARLHGADGSEDVTGNLLRSGSPFGTHDTHGWPTFAGWPVHDTITHQQTYYVWLKRVWKAGLRLVVAQTVEDQPFCRIEPHRVHSCDETKVIKLEIERLQALQRYVDAQAGGPGRGWFRLVYTPQQARRVIEQGKLAVLIGIESSDLLGCSEFEGKPDCDRAKIDRGIRAYRRLGVRTMFVAHWVNNAFAGAALEGGAKGSFINVLNALQTGRYFATGPCPDESQGEEVTTLSKPILQFLSQFFPAASPVLDVPIPTYPEGRQCNARGLTGLGRYLIRRLIANHMLIEVDHLSEKAREEVLAMAEARHYPGVVSSHTGTGGAWTPSELRRLYALGGFATATPDTSPQLADRIVQLRQYKSDRHYFGVGLGTDTGGFSSLPGPRADASQDPLRYPFKSYDGQVEFFRQRTGEQAYNLNTDGVAHYGLFADLLADMQQQPRGPQAMRLLFRSAEAYLGTWQRAVAHP